ncbi:MAG: S-adenosylmethionine:tRNA ribosyltransferase-isomerase [Bernardetiaceae bacterium]|nr:S-adenosylmethionine:tRNA ribosyltransferase-isomerase [Bernardetiaceae bacterium]
MIPEIRLQDYTYTLPPERIAQRPLEQRSASKLLCYRSGAIHHHQFHEITSLLPVGATFFFNNTKVIPARMFFQKETGAWIEVFLLRPFAPSQVLSEAMRAQGNATWFAMIGNLKRWKDKDLLSTSLNVNGELIELTLQLIDRSQKLIRFEWESNHVIFIEIIEALGRMPLPPYIKREAESSDADRYQTVFGVNQGAVAAPTAGLHFDEPLLEKLSTEGFEKQELTLHVGAGTFQPVQDEHKQNVATHPMHAEQILVKKAQLEALHKLRFAVPVGTTSLRTMESLYWLANLWANDTPSAEHLKYFRVPKLVAYQLQNKTLLTRQEAFEFLLKVMEKHQIQELIGETEIFILPGYDFKVADALITNFHMPETTLMLLVAAFIGDEWRAVYQAAIDNNYRFLSYGDSSLLFKK